jgi:hypothetical protein
VSFLISGANRQYEALAGNHHDGSSHTRSGEDPSDKEEKPGDCPSSQLLSFFDASFDACCDIVVSDERDNALPFIG